MYDHETPLLGDLADLLYSGIAFTALFKIHYLNFFLFIFLFLYYKFFFPFGVKIFYIEKLNLYNGNYIYFVNRRFTTFGWFRLVAANQ